MMSDAEIDKFFDSLKEWFKQFVDERIDKKLEPMRELLLDEITPESQVGPLVDALAVAEFMGCDLSTPKSKKAARQMIYHLVRKGEIPYVRVSKRRLKFDLGKVQQKFAAAEVPPHLANNSSPGTAARL
jgi:hypothetical protein